MKIDSEALCWSGASFSGLATYLLPRLCCPTFVALNGCWSFNPDALGAVDYVLQGLWTWVSESKVPDFGKCAARSPLSVAIEAITSSEEGASCDIFRKIFEDKLVVTVFEESENGVICTP